MTAPTEEATSDAWIAFSEHIDMKRSDGTERTESLGVCNNGITRSPSSISQKGLVGRESEAHPANFDEAGFSRPTHYALSKPP